jgi:dihydroorotate dehydrogenase electron transfer subunit
MKEKKIYVENCGIIENTRIAEDIYLLAFTSNNISKEALCGQFVNIKIPGDNSLILRRPISIYDTKDGSVSVIYSVVGKGTKIMAELKQGDFVEVLGPLGQGFKINPDKEALIVGGGCGIPPLYFLAKELKKKDIKMSIFLGFSSKEKIILIDELNSLTKSIHFSTDDGSVGNKGNVIELLKEKKASGYIYSCGPHGLLIALQKYANDNKLLGQASLEERMGCGFGVCLGCAFKTKGGEFKYVCKDGPVFDLSDIAFDVKAKTSCG